MEKTLKIKLLIVLLAATFIAGSATAGLMPIPADAKTQVAGIANSPLGSLGLVDSYVYRYTAGAYTNKYLYTYKLTSTNIGISFFSIGVDDTANLTLNVANVNYEGGGVAPTNWRPVGAPLQSVDAGFFVTPIYSGQASALLWFVCDYAPVMGLGSVFGTSSGVPTYAVGQLYTIPEPTTIIMLTTGALWGYMRRKKRAV
ncbi:MAG: PEP-CTERM sorting domain-containing protein [Planctomycetes bacterium]|nr:PEP-CTERM sorting domain-containing protein [Planctomycetota bacterium]